MTNYSNNLYSKEDSCSSDESDGEEKEAQEVLFITQETQNDEHKNIDTNETDSKGEFTNDLIERQKKKNMKQETLCGTKNKQEEIEEKLRNAKEETIKLRNKNEELKSELNYEFEEKETLKEQFEEAKKNG